MAEGRCQNKEGDGYQQAEFLRGKKKMPIKNIFKIRKNAGRYGVQAGGKKTDSVSVSDRRSPDSTELQQPPQLPSDNQQNPSSRQGLEKVFIMDQHLLQYLRDCPKANKALTKQLIALGSYVQLFPETERAVVKGEGTGAEPTPLEWLVQVDKIFDTVKAIYQQHYEMDPTMVKVLKSNVAVLETEEVKVYLEEDDFAVIVGRIGDVKEKLKMLEETCLSERQYNLKEKEELEKEPRLLSPGVMIYQNGPNQEVQLGLTTVQELLKGIQQKRILLPTALLDFLVSSDSVSRYQAHFEQNLCCPVAMEIGSELILSSLSSDALEEAATMVLKDLYWFTEPLEGAAGQPAALDTLKEALRKAQDEANITGPRVAVKYHLGSCGDPRTKVQLVGYNEEVGRLKKVLEDHQLYYAEVRESFPLPLAEMVDSFDKVKYLMGLNLDPGVGLTSSHSPSPCVTLSGPRGLVQKVLHDIGAILVRVTWKKVILDGQGASLYYLGEGKRNLEQMESRFHVLIWPQQLRQNLTSAPTISQAGIAASSTRGSIPHPASTSDAFSQADLHVVLGYLEQQQVDGLVAPMVNTQLQSCVHGICLNSQSSEVQTNFNLAAAGRCFAPGEVLEVELSPPLKSRRVFFIECLPWDAEQGQSEKALRTGLALVLNMCRQQGLSSVALPVIGPGRALKFPSREAVQILTDEILKFLSCGSSGSVSSIHMVIKPGYPSSDEDFQHVYKGLSARMLNWRGKAVFRSLTSDLDTITMEIGGVQVQLVFGDITDERTDVVVNPTDFVDLESDVCKAILTKAGPTVETELRSARVTRGGVFETKPGGFPCKSILHMSGQKNTAVIQGLVCNVMKTCDQKGYLSVAIPAICAGKGGLNPKLVADSILKGVMATASSTSLHHLKLVRLVLVKIDVFLAFKSSAETLFHNRHTISAPLSQPSDSQRSVPPHPPPSTDPDLSSLLPTSHYLESPSEFLVLGLCDKDMSEAGAEIKKFYQDQCSQHSFKREDLSGLTQADLDMLGRQVSSLNLTIKLQGGAEDPGQPAQEKFILCGLRDGVTKVVEQLQTHRLQQRMREKEQEVAYARVSWCMMGPGGEWERFPKEANLRLDRQEVHGGVVDGLGRTWEVDFTKMEAIAQDSGRVTMLKRLENFEDFCLPLDWDSMAPGESMKLVEITSSSEEFRRVTRDFQRTVSDKAVLKMERVQNVHLRKAYAVKKKQIEEKRGLAGGEDERLLFHGTSPEGSKSILKNGFNRSFAGQNATTYGKGTYFAVKASRSADSTYSRPDQHGNQVMFVARVLTGQYTRGEASMMMPPPLSPQAPDDHYDSLVDNVKNPTLFVIFHDDQAYPEYLITFRGTHSV